MNIIGAGMAGLLAANMLRRFEPIVFESGPSLPNNHEALLRFRTDKVSKATGIPFKKVTVTKAIYYDGEMYSKPNIRFSNLYSYKVTGKVEARSIMNLDSGDRYIAPLDFISRLSRGVNIQYGVRWDARAQMALEQQATTISTIPMPALMDMAQWSRPRPIFPSRSVAVITATLDNTDVYQTIYYPGKELQYRASITGNKLMVEFDSVVKLDQITQEEILSNTLRDFGMDEVFCRGVNFHIQMYGKITPIDNGVRKQFILAMSDKHSIYSLGRYATWRPLLLDDLVHDIDVIGGFIQERDDYSRLLSQQ